MTDRVQHFAFGDISKAFEVQLGKLQPMFEDFKKLGGVKKILSFGGWSFSTEADTFPIFRDGVTPAERLTFAENVVKFAIDNNLDGLDFDWEYPGMLRVQNCIAPTVISSYARSRHRLTITQARRTFQGSPQAARMMVPTILSF
jgi:GH18 family chitinase